jgi:hypothetical protein
VTPKLSDRFTYSQIENFDSTNGYFQVAMYSGVRFGSIELVAKFSAESGTLFWCHGQFGLYVDKALHGFVSTEDGDHWFEVGVPGLDAESRDHYFAMTYNDTTHDFATYLDGHLAESSAIAPLTMTDRATVQLLIGHIPLDDIVVPRLEWGFRMFRLSSAVRPPTEIAGFSTTICDFNEDLSCPISDDFTTLLLVHFNHATDGDTLAPGDQVTDHSAKSESMLI